METWQKSIDFHKEQFSFFGQLSLIFVFFFFVCVIKQFVFSQDSSMLLFILGIFSSVFSALAIESYNNFSFLEKQDGSTFPELDNNLIYSRQSGFF